jgi:hypothetical protein
MSAAALRAADTPPEFSLAALARAVLAESGSEDREQLLKEIERQIPAAQLAEAFRQALPAFVHQVQLSRWPSRARPGGGRSAKVTAIRETWRRHLDGRYTVEDGSLRKLGDFGRGDLIFMAGRLETQARSVRARAVAMESLAAALDEHGAERVRDLPDAFLAEFFGQAAA